MNCSKILTQQQHFDLKISKHKILIILPQKANLSSLLSSHLDKTSTKQEFK